MDTLDRVKAVLGQLEQGKEAYYIQHLKGYGVTLEELVLSRCRGGAALEIGYTDLFQFLLAADLGFHKVVGTEFRDDREVMQTRPHSVAADGMSIQSSIVRVNIEHEMLPLPDESFDLILCSEVIEHMDVDPMYALCEFNRLLRVGGTLVLPRPQSWRHRRSLSG